MLVAKERDKVALQPEDVNKTKKYNDSRTTLTEGSFLSTRARTYIDLKTSCDYLMHTSTIFFDGR